jgi:deoxyribonuclease V
VIKINHELLRDDLTIDEALMLQIKYQKIILNQKQIREKSHFTIENVKWLVGVDISYFRRENQEFGVSCAVLWNLRKNKIKTYSTAKNMIRFPYKAGFLGFRECNLISKAIGKLHRKIDLIICDGHGIIHPRRFGEAVQLGFALDIPSIGVAKNPFIGYSEWKNLQKEKGEMAPIWANNPQNTKESSQELLGYSICLNDGSKPVFISPGYKTTIKLAIEIALKSTLNHRLPEPLYCADSISRKVTKSI